MSSMLDGDRGGATYDHDRDYQRLNAQMKRVFDAIRYGDWFTPAELEKATGDDWASISARLRDLRKEEYGAWLIDGVCVSRGLWHYRLAGKAGEPPAVKPGKGTLVKAVVDARGELAALRIAIASHTALAFNGGVWLARYDQARA